LHILVRVFYSRYKNFYSNDFLGDFAEAYANSSSATTDVEKRGSHVYACKAVDQVQHLLKHKFVDLEESKGRHREFVPTQHFFVVVFAIKQFNLVCLLVAPAQVF